MFDVGNITKDWAEAEGLAYSYFESLESTNQYAKKNLESFKDFPHLIITNHQTQGKGRGDNQWISETPGKYLTMSIAFKLSESPQPIAAACFGWAVYRALSETFNVDFSLKAPNDIYLHGYKVGGILLESQSQGADHHLIFGLGLNVFKHPELSTSKCFTDFSEKEDLQKNQWTHFLSSLYALCPQAALESQQKVLSQTLLTELKEALQRNTSEHVTDLQEDGSLVFENGKTLSWSDL